MIRRPPRSTLFPYATLSDLDTVVRGPSLPVVFEATGVDGIRQIGFCNGAMQEVDSDEYDQLLAGEVDDDTLDDGRQ